MAMLIPTKVDPQTGLPLTIVGIPQRLGEPTFNSYLILKQTGHENHTLTLELKIFLKQHDMSGAPSLPYLDYSKQKLFFIKPWPPSEWVKFQQKFKEQCLIWNDRFWLIPPVGFSKLDVKAGAHKVRPNIYCHLSVDVVGSSGGTHRTIDVVNLDVELTTKSLGIAPGHLHAEDFGSDTSHYSSLDVNVSRYSVPDNHGNTHTMPFLTIPHEIGHALGLPHIGVSHHDPKCQIAIILDALPFPTGPINALFQGGTNAPVCYGSLAPRSHAENVMGTGMKFDETNAQPWVDRVVLHTQTNASGWKVSKHHLRPKPV